MSDTGTGKHTAIRDTTLWEVLPPDATKQEIISFYEAKLYNYGQLLEVSRSLCSTLELPQLIETIIYSIMGQMSVLGGGLFIKESFDSNTFKLGGNHSGLDLDPSYSYEIFSDSRLMVVLSSKERVYTIAELEKLVGKDDYDIKSLRTLKPSLIVPLFLKNRVNGILVLGERLGNAFSDYDKKQILINASIMSIAVNNASLVEQSSTDMMTHLKLKYYFFNALTDKLDSALSQNLPLSVIMFDIDHFKRFNDTYGHACGDYVLQTVAKIIRNGIRGQDMASRYGGEEFTVMLYDTSLEEAKLVAERIRTSIQNYDFTYENQHMKVTISGGISVFSTDNNPINSASQLVNQADQALYLSKRNGRNRVTYADPAVIAASDPTS